MCKIIPRIKQIAENEGITIGALERAIGASKGVISRAINNGTDIQAKWLQSIVENYPRYSSSWLLTGDGEMFKDLRDKVTAVQTDTPETGIPLIPIEAMAGFFTGEVAGYDKNCERFIIPGIKADFVVAVSGDSMEPKYYSGDLVACQMVSLSDLFFQWGKVYVIDTDQGVLIKKVKRSKNAGHITLVSENPDYDDIEVQYSHIYHISLVKAIVRFT